MVFVECLGQKQYSSAKDDIGGVAEMTWSEHLFCEPRGVDKQDAEEAKKSIDHPLMEGKKIDMNM